jgi:hypothetical protein
MLSHLPSTSETSVMKVLFVRNVNDAYYAGCQLMSMQGKATPSRNGPVLRIAEPVSTVYSHPVERVLFDPRRNANPFFHLFEALWMLNGGNDVETLDEILPSFKQFSDDGQTYHGAYGYRWRHWPKWVKVAADDPDYQERVEIDQLALACEMLRKDPTSRRVVIGMWDPARDLAEQSNDLPCNDLIKFSITDGKLHMRIFCRSNDIIFGAYGANAVHMSVLFEYMAAMTGTLFGTMTQISDDFHAYTQTPYNFADLYPPYHHLMNAYEVEDERPIRVHPLVTDRDVFDQELHEIMQLVRERALHAANIGHISNAFFHHVVQPMYTAFRLYKEDRMHDAIATIQKASSLHAHDIDWLYAAEQWLGRIADKRAAKEHPLSIMQCSACGEDHPNIATREPTAEEEREGITAVATCPKTGTEVFIKINSKPDGASAPPPNVPKDSFTARYQSWRDKPHEFVEQKGSSGCATCGYGSGAIFHNSFEVARAKEQFT